MQTVRQGFLVCLASIDVQRAWRATARDHGKGEAAVSVGLDRVPTDTGEFNPSTAVMPCADGGQSGLDSCRTELLPDGSAVFTDVKQIGKLLPQANIRKSPIRSGYSFGHRSITAGTLGAPELFWEPAHTATPSSARPPPIAPPPRCAP